MVAEVESDEGIAIPTRWGGDASSGATGSGPSLALLFDSDPILMGWWHYPVRQEAGHLFPLVGL